MATTTPRWTKTSDNTWTNGTLVITRQRGIANLTVFIARDADGRQVARTDSLATCKAAVR